MSKKLISKNRVYLISAILFVGVLAGCTNKSTETNTEAITIQKKASFTNITPELSKKRLENEEGIILLDVRTKEEYEAGHIKDSVLIPVYNLKEQTGNILKDKEATIFVYCRSGSRSVTAANILIEQGYKNVYNLGGLNDWPYEIVK